MAMTDHMPQPTMKNLHELRVSLHLPAGVVIPPLYLEEKDAGTISRALQLGADAVYHLRSKATELTLQVLTEQKMSELTLRIQRLEAELSDARDEARREVERRLEEHRLAMEKDLEPRNNDHNEEIAKQQRTCAELRQNKSAGLANLELQRNAVRLLDAEMQTVRNDERQKANDDVQNELSASKSRVADVVSRLDSLKLGSKSQLEEERKELDEEQTKPSSDDTQQPPKRRKVIADLKTSGAGKLSLRELIQEVFGKLEGFRLQNFSNDLVTAQICKLQTLWRCRDNFGDMAGQIKTELGASPTTDVAFLVALQTGVVKHTEQVVEVEFVSQCQTLVHVNRLTDEDDPLKLLREYVCPLLSALHSVKQAYTASDDDAANRMKITVRRCTAEANTLRTVLKEEAKGLELDRMQSEKQFDARQKWIDKGEAAVEAILKELVMPGKGSAAPETSLNAHTV